jgi:predicted nucleotidyltransferase component of viral defense system
MITFRPQDTVHKTHMLRLLRAVCKNTVLANALYFKGGTCAALRGVLDRFSVDLDFDLPDISQYGIVKEHLYPIFEREKFKIKDKSTKHLQFFLRYNAVPNARNTVKLEIYNAPSKKNEYEKVKLREVDMFCNTHTIGTMVANKLVAATNRLETKGKPAGRDYYDLHSFFLQGLPINKAVVEDVSGMAYIPYLEKLMSVVEDVVTEDFLQIDLNPLLPADRLNFIRDKIRPELLVFLRDEIKRNT